MINQFEFIQLITEGNLLKIQEYYNTNENIYISYNNDEAFCIACCYGYLEVAKWLLTQKPDIDIFAEYDYAFRFSCANGHFELAKWLLIQKPYINSSAKIEYAFSYACFNGYLEVAKWLLIQKPDINISLENEYAFRFACNYGHLEVAKWLLIQKPDINISLENEYAFRVACNYGHLEVAKWLTTLNAKYQLVIQNNRIISWTITKELPINSTIKIKLDTLDKHDKTCHICIENQVTHQSNCKHNYCFQCISKLYESKKCPYCRCNLTLFYLIEFNG